LPILDKTKIQLNTALSSLRHREFKLYWAGMSISLIGTWMQIVGQSWLVYSLTNSPFLLGLVGVLQFTPMLFFSLFAGALLDKVPKRKILLITQSVAMSQAIILAVLILSGNVKYWHILILATLLGLSNTFDMPARQSFIIELAGREDLMSAIALNSSAFNAARIVGPAIAGLTMASMGIGFCFIVNGVSFLPILLALIFIKPVNNVIRVKSNDSIIVEIKKGLSFIKNNKILIEVIIAVGVIGTFAMNFNVLVPVFTKSALNQGEAGYGLLMSAMGVGSFLGAISVATSSKNGTRNTVLIICSLSIAALMITTGFTYNYYLVALVLGVTGFFSTRFFTTANSMIQYNVTDEFRGRVTSVYTLVMGGTTPIGNFFAGSVASIGGPRVGFIVCGITILVSLLIIFKLNKKNRKLLREGEQN